MQISILGKYPVWWIELALSELWSFGGFALLDMFLQLPRFDDVGFVEGAAAHDDLLLLLHGLRIINIMSYWDIN